MRKKVFAFLAVLAVLAGAAFWVLTSPRTFAAANLPDRTPDLKNGAYLFVAGGCASCHAARDAKGDDLLKLAGGQALASPFGTFHVPNISPDPQFGIGKWSTLDFVNAMKFGVRPDGAHLYPSFPYVSYQRMKVEDLIDLRGYLATLPAVAAAVPDHDLPFPFNLRRGVGLWKLLYVDGRTLAETGDPKLSRGAYLVLGPGHCGECHTPRNFFGGPKTSLLLAGGRSPSGRGYIPNITPDEATGIGGWSEDEIVQLLETGFTPDFDAVGGDMAEVVRNTARLSPEDRAAMAAYLKSIPPIDNPRPARPATGKTGG